MKARFPALDEEHALPAARPLLHGSRQHFGFVPSPVAKAAHAPLLLKQLLGGLQAFDQSSLGLREREVVAMTVAFHHGCHYCMALHSERLAAAPENAALLDELRAGMVLTDPRLDALRRFVLELLERRGQLDERTWQDLASAGFSEAQALEVLQGVAAYWLSTVANVLMDVELDEPFRVFAWTKPDGGTT